VLVLVLVLVCSYGSRGEIANACRSVAAQVQAGQLRAEEVGEGHVAAALCDAGCPEPDILIRTSGEHRLSNFLLWQVSPTCDVSKRIIKRAS
jgi:undecaprenyl diphosphate synthase